jgi:diadenylate cyclase
MREVMTTLNISSMIDYAIIGVVLYLLFTTIRGTKAAQIFIGFLLLYVFKTIALKLNLYNVSKGLSFLFDNLIVLVLVVFQEEIRQIVNRIHQKWLLLTKNEKLFSYQKEIVNAVSKLSDQNTGALIILEGDTQVEDHINGGTILNADISEELILTIFENYSALHDGAMVIGNNKIHSAAVVLPITKSKTLDFRFGTRHRAGIGITEILDCIAIIVSEETGSIRVAEKGKIIDLNPEELREKINQFYRAKENQNGLLANKMLVWVEKGKQKYYGLWNKDK